MVEPEGDAQRRGRENESNWLDERYNSVGFYQGMVFQGFRLSVFGTLAYHV